MSFIQEPHVFITDKCYSAMAKNVIKKEDVLWTLNYPDKEIRKPSDYYQYNYQYEKNFTNYIIGIFCFWTEKDNRWIITHCWKRKI